MRLYTIEADNKEKVAISLQNKMIPLERIGISVADMNELIQQFDQYEKKLTGDLSNYYEGCLEEEEYKILAPIPVPLQDIICLGVNYREHIDETATVVDFSGKRDAVYFSKRVNHSNGPEGIIPVYDFVGALDYEAELGVILKKDLFNISVENAGENILGYTIINDVSARDIQLKHQQWYRGKSLDGYTVMGPCIVTQDEISNPHSLNIACYVNGEKRQDSNTSYMITSIEEAIAELSMGMTLKAGTIIATGTPGGVAMGMKPPMFLKCGDIIRCEIEGIGSIENKCENAVLNTNI